jgi:hypothetical protein
MSVVARERVRGADAGEHEDEERKEPGPDVAVVWRGNGRRRTGRRPLEGLGFGDRDGCLVAAIRIAAVG